MILQRFTELIELGVTSGKSDMTTASETLQIDSHAAAIVRNVEELLTIARSLKSIWLLSDPGESALAKSLSATSREDEQAALALLKNFLQKTTIHT